ncbi:unnamed protein product [Ectocarpus sp. CCAP 1310/34]|nr:unnamed protein product [Ectocarpus sp. CCAP 1310/34]
MEFDAFCVIIPSLAKIAPIPLLPRPPFRSLLSVDIDAFMRLLLRQDGSVRINVNYKSLNALVDLDGQPLTRVDGIWDSLYTGKVFSIFDLNSAFHQIVCDEDTVPLTAFCTPTHLFEWLRMPQGANASPPWFVKVINRVVHGLERVLADLDDVICFDEEPLGHVLNMIEFFKPLRQYTLELSPGKARVGATPTNFLGHTISPAGVSPDGVKIRARKCRRRRMLSSFGAFSMDSAATGNSSRISPPRCDLSTLFSNKAFPSTALLFLRSVTGPFWIWRLVALFGPSNDFAVIFWSTKFIIYSDHKALESIGKVGEHNARVQRWLEFLSNFTYTLKYRKGSAISNVDILSRLPLPAQDTDKTGPDCIDGVGQAGVFFIRACGHNYHSPSAPEVPLAKQDHPDRRASAAAIRNAGISVFVHCSCATGVFAVSGAPCIPDFAFSTGAWYGLRRRLLRTSASDCQGQPYILLFTDHFSRRADMFAVTAAEFTAKGTAHMFVNQYMTKWGCPTTLFSDNGLHFCSKLSMAIYDTNGGTERVNHTMAQMLAVVVNEQQHDWDVHLPHVEFAYNNSANQSTGLAPNEIHIGRIPRLPLSVFDHPTVGGHQSLARDQLDYCNLTVDRQRRAYELVREYKTLKISRVERRNSSLLDAIHNFPQFAVGGWSGVYNTAATIRQGVQKDTDQQVLKAKFALSWTGPHKVLAVGPASADSVPDGRPLARKLLYLDLPSDLSGPAARCRVPVLRFKPCRNPYETEDLPQSLPAEPSRYVLHSFGD